MSYPGEVFFSDTSPMSSPYPTGASTFAYPAFSSKLKHSYGWSSISPQGQWPRSSRGLSSVEESAEWRDREAERVSPAALDHVSFYKRIRPTKDTRELSSPKKTEEAFPEAKEQKHSSQKLAIQTTEGTPSRNGTSQTVSNRKSAHSGGLQVAPTRKHVLHRGESVGQLTGLNSQESMDYPRTRSKGPEINVGTTVARTRPGDGKQSESKLLGKDSGPSKKYNAAVERTTSRESLSSFQDVLHKRGSVVSPQKSREDGFLFFKNGKGDLRKDSRSKAAEDRNTSRGSLPSLKDTSHKRGSVVSPRETVDALLFSKEHRDDFKASMSSFPGPRPSPKGPISPGDWKVPSSARILTEEEVFRDPL